MNTKSTPTTSIEQNLKGLRITLVAVGTRGDVYPVLALGQRLESLGAKIRVFSHPEFESVTKAFGLEYQKFSLSFEEAMGTELGSRWLETGEDFEAYIREISTFLRAFFSPRLEEITNACRDSQLLLFTYLGISVFHIGEKLKIPTIATWPTGAALYPSVNLPHVENANVLPFGPLRNALAHYMCEIPIHRYLGQVQNEWREILGLKKVGFPGIYSYLRRSKLPILYGFSKHLAPPPRSWPEYHHITGYWLPASKLALDPVDPKLVSFLENGPAPIFLGFGSVRLQRPQAVLEESITACKALGLRAVFAAGKIGLNANEIQSLLPREMIAVETAPHEWLFPKMRAIVHHGGANTTGAACRAGVPSIAVCFCADAALWAQRLVDLGIGGPAIFRESLCARTLRSSIEVALRPETQARARAFALELSSEDGVGEASAAIAYHMKPIVGR